MSVNETNYTFAVETPQYLERARQQIVTMPAYRDGALVTPSGGNYTLYNASNTVVTTGAVNPAVGGITNYTVTAAVIPSTLELGERWREEWALTMPDSTVRTVRRGAGLVLRLLYPVVSLVHLKG